MNLGYSGGNKELNFKEGNFNLSKHFKGNVSNALRIMANYYDENLENRLSISKIFEIKNKEIVK